MKIKISLKNKTTFLIFTLEFKMKENYPIIAGVDSSWLIKFFYL